MKPLRLPNITGETPEKQLTQLKSYIFQLVQDLNYALSELERMSKEGK